MAKTIIINQYPVVSFSIRCNARIIAVLKKCCYLNKVKNIYLLEERADSASLKYYSKGFLPVDTYSTMPCNVYDEQ